MMFIDRCQDRRCSVSFGSDQIEIFIWTNYYNKVVSNFVLHIFFILVSFIKAVALDHFVISSSIFFDYLLQIYLLCQQNLTNL